MTSQYEQHLGIERSNFDEWQLCPLGHQAIVLLEVSAQFTITDLPFGVGWDATDSMPGSAERPGVLNQFVTGDAARYSAALGAETRIASFQRQLDAVYPEGTHERSATATSVVWAHERYTGGGYAIYAPGQMARFWPLLRQPHGVIWFAGEHTETLAGYLESAVRSGRRVAAAIGRAPR